MKTGRYQVLLLMVTLLAIFPATVAGAPRPSKVNETVLEAEQLLDTLGYWIRSVDGVTDTSTRHAVVAFQKVEGLKRTGVISAGLVSALQNATRPEPRFSSAGRHVEIDIGRQVLFLVDEPGKVLRILPVSTGNEKPYYEEGKRQKAHTPGGVFKIYRQIKGVRRAPLGMLYYPNYFTGGVAIHGSQSIPPVPASHGCVRIPRFAEREFSSLVTVGTYVFVYD